jgi:hypothetical protein
VDISEQIFELVKQWSAALDQPIKREALRQIAMTTGCIPQLPEQWTDQQDGCVIQWLKENHPNAYLWAISQNCVGHPAMVWGVGIVTSRQSRRSSKIASRY